MTRSVSISHDELGRESGLEAIGPLAEIGIVLLLVGLTWFLIAA